MGNSILFDTTKHMVEQAGGEQDLGVCYFGNPIMDI